jgi:hypothetical protein
MKTETTYKIISYVLLVTMVINAIGCVAVVGTPEGMKAYSDMQNGLITNGKSSIDAHTEYFAARNTQEMEETKRSNAPSFLGELLGK